MRVLVVVLMVLGFIVGGIPLVGTAIDVMTSSDDNIVFQGGYAPLTSVQMSRDYESTLDISFRALPDTSPRWLILAAYPLIGAALGALTAAVLGRRGWRLTRA